MPDQLVERDNRFWIAGGCDGVESNSSLGSLNGTEIVGAINGGEDRAVDDNALVASSLRDTSELPSVDDGIELATAERVRDRCCFHDKAVPIGEGSPQNFDPEPITVLNRQFLPFAATAKDERHVQDARAMSNG
jgi:hypothetical protein